MHLVHLEFMFSARVMAARTRSLWRHRGKKPGFFALACALLLVVTLWQEASGGGGGTRALLHRKEKLLGQRQASSSSSSSSKTSTLLRARLSVAKAAMSVDCSSSSRLGLSSNAVEGDEAGKSKYDPCQADKQRVVTEISKRLQGSRGDDLDHKYHLGDGNLLRHEEYKPFTHTDGVGGILENELSAEETVEKVQEEAEKEAERRREQEEKRKQEELRKSEQEEKKKQEQKKKKEQEQKKKKEQEEKRKREQERKRVEEELAKECRPLPGTGKVIDGSALVRTSVDLRGTIVPGDGVRLGGRDFLVREPQDAVTFTIDRPWSGGNTSTASTRYSKQESKTQNKTVTTTTITTVRTDAAIITSEVLPMCKIMPKNRIDGCKRLSCTGAVLQGSMTIRTSCDLRAEVRPGETIFVNSEVSCVVAMDGVYSNEVLTCEKAWALATANAVTLCKRRDGFTGFGNTPGLFKLSGGVATTKHSQLVMTTDDLRFEISPGDSVRIRTEQFIVRPPVLARSFAVDHPSALPSEDGLTAYKISPCFTLPGTVAATKGSRTLTTSDDMRSEVTVGDIVEIDGSQFEAVDVPDAFTIMISRAWAVGSRDGMVVMKCPVAAQSGTQLSGTCKATKGSAVVFTSEDLTSEISASDLITIGAGSRTYVLVEPMSAGSLTLESPFEGESLEARCWREPESERDRTLEQLALKKLQCQTIYCLAKIEEQERSLSFGIPRSLSASDMVNGLESALMVHGNDEDAEDNSNGDFNEWMKNGEKLDAGPIASVNKAMLEDSAPSP